MTTNTTVATRPSRAEINRMNACMSTGPRSPAGKQRSKYNALKHGMTARTLVLPGEDPQKLQIRLETWTDQLQPQNDVEQCLLEQAVHATWKLDRAERAELAHLAHNIESVPRAEAERQQDVAAALGYWLLSDRDVMGSIRLHSNLLDVLVPDQKRTYPDCRHVDVLDHPESIVRRLESTAAGCRWLLDRWAELGAELDKGVPWELAEKARALRLLGKRPLGLEANDWAVYLEDRGNGKALMSDEVVDGRLDAELDERLGTRKTTRLAVLGEIVHQAVARLEGLAAEHRRRDEAEAARQADILSFDASVEGERLRRYQSSCSRNLFRSLDVFLKIRKSGATADRGAKEFTAAQPEATAAQSDLCPDPPAAHREDSRNEPIDTPGDGPAPHEESHHDDRQPRAETMGPREGGTPTSDPVDSCGSSTLRRSSNDNEIDGLTEVGTPTGDAADPRWSSAFRRSSKENEIEKPPEENVQLLTVAEGRT